VCPVPAASYEPTRQRVYLYLLRGLAIDRPNQVWAANICYSPTARGFLYLVAIMDWHSRKVLAWRLWVWRLWEGHPALGP